MDKKIAIDLVGAMEKITPEMLDKTRDLIIEGLTNSGTKMRDGLTEIIAMCEDGKPVDEIAAVARKALP